MVGAVQHLGRGSHHSPARNHSGSTGFTLPSLPESVAGSVAAGPTTGASNLLSLQEAPIGTKGTGSGGAAGATLRSDGGKVCVGAQYRQFIGRSTGSGQCVALAQAATPGLGSTHGWSSGEAVQGNTGLQPGTVIATFDGSGRYSNATDGSNHAAIYLGQNERGIQVLDQWSGSVAAVRTIAWKNPSGVAANTGSAFHVVRTRSSPAVVSS